MTTKKRSRNNEDRLSNLPDCVLHEILKHVNLEEAVRTCILSTRWKNLWKSLPIVIFRSAPFSSLKIFTKFVSNFLSLRDHSLPLPVLCFQREKGPVELPLIKKVLQYAISHDIQKLGLFLNRCDDFEKRIIPTSIFSCQTLTLLQLVIYPRDISQKVLFPKSVMNLPALTSLHLENFSFGVADPFSNFKKLEDLSLAKCDVRNNARTLCISSSTLVSLSMVYPDPLESLDIVELCTPSLDSFSFSGVPDMVFRGRINVQHVEIDNYFQMEGNCVPNCLNPSGFLLSMLRDFVGIKSLVLTSTTLEVLSLMDILASFRKDELSPFLDKLETLKVLNKKQIPTLLVSFIRLVESKTDNKVLKLWDPNETTLGIVDLLLHILPSSKVEILHV